MSDLKDFVIEDGVLTEYVGNGGDVVIPEGITGIRDRAFGCCKSLKSITIPDGVTSIGNSAFSRCINLTNITIPESVTSIGNSAFSGCLNLTRITIPAGVTRIGDRAFNWCKNLTSITIPAGVSRIGDKAFKNCKKLESITIPANVKNIRKSAFDACDNLRCIHAHNPSVLPTTYRMAAALSFLGSADEYEETAKKTYIQYVKRNIEKMMDALINTPDLLAVACQEKLIPAKNAPSYLKKAQELGNVQAVALLLDYSNTKLSAAEKQRVEKKKELDEEQVFDRLLMRQGKEGIDGLVFVVSGSLKTFCNRTEIKDFIISKGGRLASSVSAKVDYLIMNEDSTDSEKKKKAENLGIECITELRFNDISGRSFQIEDGVLKKYLGTGGDVTIPDSVTSIGDGTFWECKKLTSITIPDGVTSIGDSAFRGCENLTSITIPDGVTSIGDSAFYGCENLTSITIPNGVTSIGILAFDGCKSLTIHAPAGSYAEQYAKENNIPFVAE